MNDIHDEALKASEADIAAYRELWAQLWSERGRVSVARMEEVRAVVLMALATGQPVKVGKSWAMELMR